MFSKGIVSSALATALVTAGSVAAVASAGPGSSVHTARPSATPQISHIKLVERELGRHVFDQGPRGISAGDRVQIVSVLLDPAGKRIGDAAFQCAAMGTGRHGGGMCQGVVTLADGQLTTQFAFGPSGETKLQAVTGGTGRYEGARGQFVVTEGRHDSENVLIELLG